MTKEELVEIITCGETSTVQFKQQMTTSKQIAEEMVAFANCKGGRRQARIGGSCDGRHEQTLQNIKRKYMG